jgi:hypothetical protein
MSKSSFLSILQRRGLISTLLTAALVAASVTVPGGASQAYITDIDSISANAPGAATISGDVFEVVSGARQPVEGIIVRARFEVYDSDFQTIDDYILTDTTDALGRYSITGFASGSEARLFVSDSARPRVFADGSAAAVVRAGQNARERDIRVYRLPAAAEGTLAGTLSLAGSGPLHPARVSFRFLSGAGVAVPSVNVSTDGTFTAPNLPVGDYELVLSYDGDINADYSEPSNLSFSISAGTITTKTFTWSARPAGQTTLSGRLLEASDNSPVVGATVFLQDYRSEQYGSYTTTTAADGTWSISNVRAGDYVAYYNSFDGELWGQHIRPQSQILTVPATGTLSAPDDFLTRLEQATGTLTVTVRSDIDNRPLANARVNLELPNASPFLTRQALTNPQGRVTFSDLPAAVYQISAVDLESGGFGFPRDFALPASGNRSTTVYVSGQFRDNGTVRGFLKDQDNNPIPDMRVDLSYSSTYYLGGCAGDGWGTGDLTDADGYYEITRVLTNEPLSLLVSNLDLGPSYGEYQTTLTAAPGVNVLNDIVLGEGYKITGSIVRQDNSRPLPDNLSVEIYSATNGDFLRYFNLGSDGVIETAMLPDVPVNIFFRHLRCGPSIDPGLVSGFLKSSGGSYVLTGSVSEATVFSKPVGNVTNLGEIALPAGAQISGRVGLKVGQEIIYRSQKDFVIVVYRKNGSAWTNVSKLYPDVVNTRNDGSFNLRGLPAGEYKIGAHDPNRLSDYETAFIGESGTVEDLDDAKVFNVSGTGNTSGQELVMTPRRPGSPLSAISFDSLNGSQFAGQRNQFEVARANGANGDFQLKVGEEFAGEWFFIDLVSTGASITTQSTPTLFSTSNQVQAFSGSQAAVSDWYQVSSSGLVTLAGTSSFNNSIKGAVRDSANRLFGWADLTSAASGQGFSLPSQLIPKLVASPALKGKTRVGRVLRVDAGLWAGTPTPRVRIQWLRCTNPVITTESSKVAGCSLIKKAKSPRYKLKKRDVGFFITAQVAGANEAGMSFVTVATSRKTKGR